MTTSWLLYSLLTGGLLTLAAWQASRALGRTRRGSRWVWVIASVAAVLLPVLALIPSEQPVTPRALEPSWSISALAAPEVLISRSEPLSPLLWIGASLLALGWLMVSQASLVRERATWSRTSLQGVPVALSESFGPAVVGVLHPEIVLPRWAMMLPPDQLALVLQHEGEHLQQQDSRLLALMMTLLVLMPWQIFLWIQLKGLRLAIELDCDERVVRNGAEPEKYGELLLSLTEKFGGRRLPAWSLPLTPFSMRHSSLERRIRALAGARPTRMITLIGLAVATIALATAFAVTPPAVPAGPRPATFPASLAEREKLSKEISKTFPLRGRTFYQEATSMGFLLGVKPLNGFRVAPSDGC